MSQTFERADELLAPVSEWLLPVATLVATVATAGSLYLSLGLGLLPCELCWYQRILMYPLVVVLGVAALEGRLGAYRTALPLSVLGGLIAAYHSYLQVAPEGATGTCTIGTCGAVQYRVVGFSIPNLSLIAFALITLAALSAWRLDASVDGRTAGQ